VELVSRSATESTWQVVGNATYAETGNYLLSIKVDDVDGSSVQTSLSVHVTDAPLTDTTPVATKNALEGNSIGTDVVQMTFTDGNPSALLSDFSASVNWGGTLGDTATVAVKLVSRTATASTWQVVGSAIYAEPGT